MFMSSILEETKYIMKKYNITANKSLGQNFLISEEVLTAIVDGAQIDEDDLIIEIGPGLGTLTKFMLEKAKKVICIELDARMIKINKRNGIWTPVNCKAVIADLFRSLDTPLFIS